MRDSGASTVDDDGTGARGVEDTSGATDAWDAEGSSSSLGIVDVDAISCSIETGEGMPPSRGHIDEAEGSTGTGSRSSSSSAATRGIGISSSSSIAATTCGETFSSSTARGSGDVRSLSIEDNSFESSFDAIRAACSPGSVMLASTWSKGSRGNCNASTARG